MFGSQKNVAPDLRSAYLDYEIDLRKRGIKVVVPLAVLFIILFGILDLTIYRNVSKELILSRVIADVFLITIFCSIFYWKCFKNIKFASHFIVISIFIQIDALILITSEGSLSPYYAGLCLTIIAMSVLLPWTFYEMFALSFVMITLYIVTLMIDSAITGDAYMVPMLVNNLFFLISTSAFCVVGSHLESNLRFKEFCLNYELKDTINKLSSTQSQLVHSEKINAIGNLSAGLLHEVNNPLNYTMTALQVMKMDPHVNQDEDLKDTMKDIEEGMNRIKTIVTDLRAFAYPEEADKKIQFPVSEVIESALRFTASETKDIEKKLSIPEDLRVSASRTHIVQVLINLISNATRAISKTDKKGLLTVEAKIENINNQDRIIVSVYDNGTGINEDTLRRVFDPFFTTNEVGKGMGLGLSVSHTIVKNHGGNLLASSKLGEGSRFYFDLPTG